MSTAIVSLVVAILAAVASLVTVVVSTRSQRRLALEIVNGGGYELC